MKYVFFAWHASEVNVSFVWQVDDPPVFALERVTLCKVSASLALFRGELLKPFGRHFPCVVRAFTMRCVMYIAESL
jgi:hypothetical protein